ncbi:MAG: type II toxin-antitoxin system VapC family toxin [Hyphomicrobiales bacterium]|jgi:predicted nucleic acid-binding protein
MRLVDTSAWIEWLIASPTGKGLEPHLPKQELWLVPTIVQMELVNWLTREIGEERADQLIAFTQLCVVAPLDTEIALSAAELAAHHKLASADAIIYATTLAYGADVLTCDAHFKGLPHALYVAKKDQ